MTRPDTTSAHDAQQRSLSRVVVAARLPRGVAWPHLTRERLARWLLPPSGGKGEIPALDGIRAIAALSIVVFHTLLYLHVEYLPVSQATGNSWYYLSMGVQLFFILSGFLLFRPYARAILTGAELPSWTRFYQRRALRILPVYWAILAVMLATQWQVAGKPLWANALTHFALIHDSFPRFNRDLNGPFWTLAVEVQFYLLLPLIAAGVARVVGRTRSAARLLGALLGVIALAEVIRWADTLLMASLTRDALARGGGSAASFILTLATMGMQGKNLEVFFVGALSATLYVLGSEHQRLSHALRRRIAWGLLAVGLAISAFAAPAWGLGAVVFTPGARWGWDILSYPLVVGLSFGALMLGIVWGGPWLRGVFEAAPLRFIGHISYSVYLWHLPILQGTLAPFGAAPLWLRLVCVFVVSYLSYQLLERPFLRRRQRLAAADILATRGSRLT
ncbi:MAG TPA: acyltransferase [Ktedonobacterales bacterium]